MCCAAHPPPHRRRRTPRHIPNTLWQQRNPSRCHQQPPGAGPGDTLPRGARGNFCHGVCGEPPEPPKRCPPLGSRCCGARWASKREKLVWHVTRPRDTVHLGTICTPPSPAIHPRTHPLTKSLSNHHLLWQPAGINAIKRVFNGLIDWSRYHV